ncbi:ion transporter [Salmonirosea aquatica]|uniref:Ion transporter n=1 Tax=Salmonirosea aquatica TaxID=2654236 RepID=A0A7C9FSS4_9BACT|nr:ion transporter [Cytophagaceae bacterium SJW1-29]
MSTTRKKVHHILTISTKGKRGFPLMVNLFIIGLIALNSLAIILHSVPEIRAHPMLAQLFIDFEVFSVIAFTIEYCLRVWASVESPEYSDPFWGRIKYMFSAWALIDLLAVLPFYLTLFTPDFALIRMLRILRVVRLFRHTKYSRALKMIQTAVRYTKEELIISYAFLLLAMLIASSIIYYIEHPAQPEAFSSIPAAMWWGVVTMTTLGYGDVYPITALGKFFGSFIAILGVALFSLPTGILASGFIEQINETKRNEKTAKVAKCPHCGKDLHT